MVDILQVMCHYFRVPMALIRAHLGSPAMKKSVSMSKRLTKHEPYVLTSSCSLLLPPAFPLATSCVGFGWVSAPVLTHLFISFLLALSAINVIIGYGSLELRHKLT